MSNPTKLDPEVVATIHKVTATYIQFLGIVAGRDIKAAIVLAPVTHDHEQTDGTTQVQVISNMEPDLVKKVLKDMSEVVPTVMNVAELTPGSFVMPGSQTAN